MRRFLWFFLGLLAFVSCQKEEVLPVQTDTPYQLQLPPGFPEPDIPIDNQLTEKRVALGKRLFYDPVLSVDSTISCASCHKQSLAFADNTAISPGVEGRLGLRNSPSLANLAYVSIFNKDGGVPRLDIQALVPIEDHNEMDLHPLIAADRLNAREDYKVQFEAAYNRPADPFSVTRALGAFMRTLISGESYYDQYRYQGKKDALTPQQVRGMQLFFSEKTNCSNCHSGFALTDDSFKNNGLYLNYADAGRARVTADSADIGLFRVPGLRNVALTAPYMHDGSIKTLAEVVNHYNNGGRGHFNQSPLVQPLGLSEIEMQDLISFLESLTDPTFISNPAFKPE